jgi:mannose-6-phosphate isomerase-like protein (cupin superfamily)
MSTNLATLAGRRWEAVDFAQIASVACPCGASRRAFMESDDFPGTVHRVEISVDARLHYHKRLTETYYFLDCQPGAAMQLDDELIPVHAGMCILIRPGVRHRAVGQMTVLNVVLPKFDPHDEWFD